MPEAAAVFRRPFDEQVAFFRGKLGNLVPTEKWDDIQKSAHDRAFMVAGAQKADLLADLAAAVDKAISEGETLEAFRARFLEIVRRRGWAGWTGDDRKDPDDPKDKGGKGVTWRTRVIYQTNLATSYAAGRLAQLKEAGYRYWVYKHSDSVLHPRPQHLAWNGLTLPADDPFWKSHYPPNGWNCFPGSTPVRCDALLGQRVWYAGEMVEIHTASGNRVAVTHNHPILTGRGWVSAQSLQQGDELLCASPDINTPLSGIVHDEHAPTCAEDLFETLSAQGLRVIPVAAHDFYGDALGMEGEIHIAGADRHLVHIVESACGEGLGKQRFNRALGLAVEAAHAAMRDSEGTLVVAQPAAAQHLLNGWLGHAKPQSDLSGAGQSAAVQAHGDAFGIGVTRIGSGPRLDKVSLAPAVALLGAPPDDPACIASPAQLDTGQSQRASDGLTTAAALLRQLLDANPGKVLIDHVVEIRKYDWSGHVYDFTTSTGLILAGGVVVSNCRCRVVGANGPEGAKLLGGNPDYNTPPAGWDAIDPKTQEPVGIDKGWGYMPGGTVADTVLALKDKLDRLPPEPSIAAIQDWLKSETFARWFANPQGSFPLARIPDADAQALGAKDGVRVASLSAESAIKQAQAHPELTAAEYAAAQSVVDGATQKAFDGKSAIYIRELPDGGHVLVVKVTQTGEGMWVTSYRRLSSKEAARDSEIRRLLKKGNG